ncbi:MAG TPA: DUF4845 domain-containing protein [Steroidobacteraceae bacterium]|nr:DUF4845 domain-containing protein [Steroidobacteraceae bacterium]
MLARRQRGVTAIGWLILLIPFAILIYAGIRLVPIYLNYMDVARSLSSMSSELGTGPATPQSIRQSLQNHFDVEGVNYPTVDQIHISRVGQSGWQVEAAYYDQAPLFLNITLQVTFDKSVTVGGGG